MRAAAFAGCAVAVLLIAGCGDGSSRVVASGIVVTNVVTVRREVAVTNLVTIVTTNVVTSAKAGERFLSARKTAPYAIASDVLDEERLRRLASDAGARVITCAPGSVALVEAREASVSSLRAGGVMSVMELVPADKIAPDAVGAVRVLPLSSIDVASITMAIRELGGEIVQVVASGKPAVRARLSSVQIHKLAARGDVRRIERDVK